MSSHYLENLLVQSRLFFYSQDSLFRVGADGMSDSSLSELEKTFLPLIIVGREHIKERNKHFPITDKKDVMQILASEVDKFTLSSPVRVEAQKSFVKLWTIEPDVVQKFHNKLCIWVPESLLFKQLDKNVIWNISRAENTIVTANINDENFSVVKRTAFTNNDTFRLSIGANDLIERSMEATQYSQFLKENIKRIALEQWLQIIKVQGFPKKVGALTDWKWVAGGLVAGIFTIHAMQLLWLQYQIGHYRDVIASQPIQKLASEKQSILDKRQALESFLSRDTSTNVEIQIWSLLGLLMERGIEIAVFSHRDNGVWVRVEYETATEAIAFIRQLPMVADASLTDAVQNSRGKQRFNLDIEFKTIDPSIGVDS